MFFLKRLEVVQGMAPQMMVAMSVESAATNLLAAFQRLCRVVTERMV